MNDVAWIFAAAFLATLALLVIAVKAYDDLAAENRQIRAENARLSQHPATPSTTPTGGVA